MKKLLLTCAIASFAFGFNAKAAFYSFSQSTATYTDLANPVSVNNSNLWDFGASTPYYPLTITTLCPNFSAFTIGCYDMRIYGGVVQFFDQSSQQIIYMNATGFVSPDALKDKGTSSSISPISYESTGTSPNKILKIQWKNAGRHSDGSGSDFLNVQIWLYQNNDVIEYHYGASSITGGPTMLCTIGVGSTYVPSSNVVEDDFLINDPSNPVLSTTSALFYNVPANGAVYRFQQSTGIASYNAVSCVKLFPTTVTDNLHLTNFDLSGGSVTVKIFDVAGNLVLSTLAEGDIEINLSFLERGMYFIELSSEKNIRTEKIIKI
jgi:hypothetical protein